MNPFVDEEDPIVVAAAQEGDRDALTEVIERHRPWVYNIALRMMGDPGSAEDATQDIFIKVLKGIGSFAGQSSFRTWLYRVAFNHLLNAKRSFAEQMVGTFEEYGAGLDAAPNMGLEDIPQPERELLVEEAMTACMTGMLLCLSRDQRIAYVLGSMFTLTDTVASEILGIPAATYRKRLQRARADLHNFMNDKCGLINEANPCRCAHKTRAFFEAGHLDRRELKFQRNRLASIGEMAPRGAALIHEKLTSDYPALYRKHPFSDPKELGERLSHLFQDTALDGLLTRPE